MSTHVSQTGGSRMLTRRVTLLALGLAGLSTPASAQDRSIVVAAGTTIQDSGLFGHILPLFKNKTGIEVKVVAQGTGQALDTARRGNADVVFVHDKVHEEKFVAEGHGVRRFDVMCKCPSGNILSVGNRL